MECCKRDSQTNLCRTVSNRYPVFQLSCKLQKTANMMGVDVMAHDIFSGIPTMPCFSSGSENYLEQHNCMRCSWGTSTEQSWTLDNSDACVMLRFTYAGRLVSHAFRCCCLSLAVLLLLGTLVLLPSAAFSSQSIATHLLIEASLYGEVQVARDCKQI